MDEQITNLKRKIVKLDDFFKDMAGAFRNKAKFQKLMFLTPNDKNGGFRMIYSTNRVRMSFSKSEIDIFKPYLAWELFYPKHQVWDWLWRHPFCRLTLIWKVYRYGISAIMPIHGSNGLSCLILFCDHGVKNWINQNLEYMKEMAQNITFCLEAIRLYNQTLEGLFKKCCPSRPTSNPQLIPTDENQIPSLVERKVEFL